jgi:ribokinase
VPGKVTSAGSINLDLTYELERLPAAGETLLSSGFQRRCGGKGANQAAAAAAAGAQVAMVGAVGADDAGDLMLEDLSARGVAVAEVQRRADVASGSAVILRDGGSGENMIIVDAGANGRVSEAQMHSDAVSGAAVVMCQLEVPLDAVQAAARACRGRFMLNIAPWQPLPDGLLAEVDVLVANQTEIAALAAGEPPTTLAATAALLRALALSCAVIVTVGGAGAVVYDPDAGDCTRISTPAVEVLDTTGAGDCFCGVLAARLGDGAALVDAARHAVVGASLSTQAVGARGLLPSLDQIRAALGQ